MHMSKWFSFRFDWQPTPGDRWNAANLFIHKIYPGKFYSPSCIHTPLLSHGFDGLMLRRWVTKQKPKWMIKPEKNGVFFLYLNEKQGTTTAYPLRWKAVRSGAPKTRVWIKPNNRASRKQANKKSRQRNNRRFSPCIFFFFGFVFGRLGFVLFIFSTRRYYQKVFFSSTGRRVLFICSLFQFVRVYIPLALGANPDDKCVSCHST